MERSGLLLDARLLFIWRHRQCPGRWRGRSGRLEEGPLSQRACCSAACCRRRNQPPKCHAPPLPVSIQALARPLRLQWHVPAQALALLAIWSRNADICATTALQDPVAQAATAAAFSALSALLPPGILLPPHGAKGQCRAVLTLVELLLGFLAPTLVLAASEVTLYRQHRSRWQQQEPQQRQKQQQQQGAAAAGPSSGGRPAGGGEPGTQAVAACWARKQQQKLADPWYELLHACLQLPAGEPADLAEAALLAVMLLSATWHAVLLLTPI